MVAIPINTYNGIKDYVIKSTGRYNDPLILDQIDNYITLAQLRLARRLNIHGTQTITTGIVLSENNIIVTPPLFIRSISLLIYDVENFNQPVPLVARTAEYVKMYTPAPTVLGRPKNYSSQYSLNSILVSPTPKVLEGATGYPYELIYHQLTQPLSDSVQQNYFTERLADILILATLVELYISLRTPELQDKYENSLDKKIQEMIGQDQLGKKDRSESSEIN